jgi:hypothetical protein
MALVMPSMAAVIAAWTFSGMIWLTFTCALRARPLSGPGGLVMAARQAARSGAGCMCHQIALLPMREKVAAAGRRMRGRMGTSRVSSQMLRRRTAGKQFYVKSTLSLRFSTVKLANKIE